MARAVCHSADAPDARALVVNTPQFLGWSWPPSGGILGP